MVLLQCCQNKRKEVKMSKFEGVLVSVHWLQRQFTQVQLHGLKSKFISSKNQNSEVTASYLPVLLAKLKPFSEMFKEDEIAELPPPHPTSFYLILPSVCLLHRSTSFPIFAHINA